VKNFDLINGGGLEEENGMNEMILIDKVQEKALRVLCETLEERIDLDTIERIVKDAESLIDRCIGSDGTWMIGERDKLEMADMLEELVDINKLLTGIIVKAVKLEDEKWGK